MTGRPDKEREGSEEYFSQSEKTAPLPSWVTQGQLKASSASKSLYIDSPLPLYQQRHKEGEAPFGPCPSHAQWFAGDVGSVPCFLSFL